MRPDRRRPGTRPPRPAQAKLPGLDPACTIGTYTGPNSKGIYVSRLNLESGALTPPELAAETKSPSFLAARPQGDFLYAVNEIDRFAGKACGIGQRLRASIVKRER